MCWTCPMRNKSACFLIAFIIHHLTNALNACASILIGEQGTSMSTPHRQCTDGLRPAREMKDTPMTHGRTAEKQKWYSRHITELWLSDGSTSIKVQGEGERIWLEDALQNRNQSTTSREIRTKQRELCRRLEWIQQIGFNKTGDGLETAAILGVTALKCSWTSTYWRVIDSAHLCMRLYSNSEANTGFNASMTTVSFKEIRKCCRL